jgi:uncharacterized protein YyaL (SSP411 family)
MPNALIDSVSPYLLQHAHNPVEWRPWGEAALRKARDEQRPIFLSIGYAACHWCHVMAHESFEDPAVAEVLNRHFVPVKVDREERPDLDAIYMDAVVALTGQGGWPLSVFLTPDGDPFHGGTYFPPQPRHGLPSFRQVLEAVVEAWRTRRAQILQSGEALRMALGKSVAAGLPRGSPLDPALMSSARENLLKGFDLEWGGWDGPPKFPQPLAIEFLLRRHRRTGDQLALDLAARALRAMSRGGMFDQVGGGFHRYATDRAWHVPHFEKMLYDQALLARAYLRAWQESGDDEFRRTAETTLDFVVRDLMLPDGGMASSLDADSGGGEGRYYLWSKDALLRELGGEGEWAMELYGVGDRPIFEGGSILRLSHTAEQATGAQQLSPAEVARLQAVKARLLAARANRERPALDDKVVAAWNGLMLAALTLGARMLGRGDLAEAADRCAQFLMVNLVRDGSARRAWRAGRTVDSGFAEDHAGLAFGLLEHYQTTFDERYFTAAVALCDSLLREFQRLEGGFFDTGARHERLVARPLTLHDAPTPSASALACAVMLRLYAMDGNPRWIESIEAGLSGVLPQAAHNPTAYAQWLLAADDRIAGVKAVALMGQAGDRGLETLRAEVARASWPEVVAAWGRPGVSTDVPLLAERVTLDLPPRAYVCMGMTCKLPAESVETLREQLAP